MNHHPISKFERLLLEEKKEVTPYEQKKTKKERSGRVRAKLAREQAKEQETEHELQEFLSRG